MGGRAVRRWLGKNPRRWWHVYRLTSTLSDTWDAWLGDLSLTGVDPRGWDLNRLLAAFEATLRKAAKDEADWRRTQAALEAEPREVRDARRREAREAAAEGRRVESGRMSVDDAEAMLARFAASEAQYG